MRRIQLVEVAQDVTVVSLSEKEIPLSEGEAKDVGVMHNQNGDIILVRKNELNPQQMDSDDYKKKLPVVSTDSSNPQEVDTIQID